MISSRFCRAASLTLVILLIVTPSAHAALLSPLSSFGGGDGFLAPGDRPYLTTDNTQRGIAYNPATGNLLIVNRAGGLSVNILDGTTGADLGALSGIGTLTGGTFAGNMIGIGDDGAIYVANLTTNATTSPFKIYRWADETSAAPTVAFSGAPLAGARLGDTLDVMGSGVNTRIVAGYGSTPSVAGNNSFALFTTADGANFSGEHIAVGTTPPDAGDFRLGITFADSDTVIGKQGTNGRIVDITGPGTGSLSASFVLDGASIRPMDYAVLGGVPVLAAVNTATDGQSMLWVYDMTNPSAPVLLASATNRTGTNLANVNGTGQVKIVNLTGGAARIYVLNTNNGIQAFEITGVPEPATCGLTLIAMVAGMGMIRRRL